MIFIYIYHILRGELSMICKLAYDIAMSPLGGDRAQQTVRIFFFFSFLSPHRSG